MNLDRFRYYFRHNTSIQLLRSRHAPLILSFLHDQGHASHLHPAGRTDRRLDDYRDALHRNDPDALPRPAREYLQRWCDEEHDFTTKSLRSPRRRRTVGVAD